MPRGRWLKLGAIGTAAGLLSGLFGVGGGSLIVPLLILWAGHDERTATGTSLAAIVVIAGIAAAIQAGYGNVHALRALEVGLPAVAGVVAGTWVQQRIPTATLLFLFAALLVAGAVDLILR
jgi:uncharacterized protein